MIQSRNHNENFFLKKLSNESEYNDFYDGKDLFQRAKIQYHTNKLLDEKNKNKINAIKKFKLNKSCSVDFIKYNNHQNFFQRIQYLKLKKSKFINQISLINKNDNLFRSKKKLDLNNIKIFIQKQRTKLYNYRKNNCLKKNENKENTPQKLILFGSKIGLKNNNNEDIEYSNSIDSFIHYYGTSIKKKVIVKNKKNNSTNMITNSTLSFNNMIPEIKKKILNNSDKKINNTSSKKFPIILLRNKIKI